MVRRSFLNRRRNLFFAFVIPVIYYTIGYAYLMPVLRCMVSSDEFLTIACGVTSFTKYDWNELVDQVARFYGGGYTILLTPIMLWVKSAYWRYFFMHFANALIHGGISVICYVIYTKYLGMADDIKAVMVCLSTSLFYFEGLEGAYIYNELPLYFTVWLLLLELLWLFRMENKRYQKGVGTILTALTMVYSLSLHTRAIFAICAVLLTAIVIRLKYKKCIFNLPILVVLLTGGYFLVEYMGKNIRSNLWSTEIVQNTIEGAFSSTGVFSEFGLLLSLDGLYAFLSLVIGRVCGMVMTSGGILCIILPIAYFTFKTDREQKKKKVNAIAIDNMIVALLFLGIVICASLFLFCVHGTETTMDALADGTINGWLFYLRYHFLYFIPLLPFIYGGYELLSHKRESILFGSIASFAAIKFLAILFLQLYFGGTEIRYRSKAVYAAFMPFTLAKRLDTIGSEILFDTVLLGTIFFGICIFFLYKNKPVKCCVVSLALSVFMFSYVMVELYIPESRENYSKIDAIYDSIEELQMQEMPTKKIYYAGFSHLEAENLQFALADWTLSEDYESADPECSIIVSNRYMLGELLEETGATSIEPMILSENQYIYFLGESWQDILKSEDD
ncbi:MAG: hypothetical protein NC081_01480 [Roseburia sp.]|nr:hypothetical protein [Roseburia sp.]